MGSRMYKAQFLKILEIFCSGKNSFSFDLQYNPPLNLSSKAKPPLNMKQLLTGEAYSWRQGTIKGAWISHLCLSCGCICVLSSRDLNSNLYLYVPAKYLRSFFLENQKGNAIG